MHLLWENIEFEDTSKSTMVKTNSSLYADAKFKKIIFALDFDIKTGKMVLSSIKGTLRYVLSIKRWYQVLLPV